jgi:hypothetical protein
MRTPHIAAATPETADHAVRRSTSLEESWDSLAFSNARGPAGVDRSRPNSC